MRAPVRLQRRRVKGARLPASAVYVGRPTKWGNPYKVVERTVMIEGMAVKYLDYDGAVAAFRSHVRSVATELAEQARAELAGRDLACWCPLDQPCHADVLLELANR